MQFVRNFSILDAIKNLFLPPVSERLSPTPNTWSNLNPIVRV